MTPALNAAKAGGIDFRVHEYAHDAAAESYGQEAVEKLGLDAARVFKTLVVDLGNRQLAVGVIPVSAMLSMKRIAKVAGARKAAMAARADVERATGYVLGGVSPLGQKRKLPTFIDDSAEQLATIYISAGRRGLELELAPEDLRTLVNGRFAALCQ